MKTEATSVQFHARIGMMAAAGLIWGCASMASAGSVPYIYDEAIDGDLPHPNWQPVLILPFQADGTNTIRFTMDLFSDGWVIDIGANEVLESFTMTNFTSPDNSIASASFHLYDGTLTTDPTLGTALYSSIDSGMIGVNFLDFYSIGSQGEGQYLFNFWHDNSPYYPTMEFDIVISTVPAPSAMALLGVTGLAGCRRRR